MLFPIFLLHKENQKNEHATGVLCSSLRYVASLSTWLSKLLLPRVHFSTTKPDPRRTKGVPEATVTDVSPERK